LDGVAFPDCAYSTRRHRLSFGQLGHGGIMSAVILIREQLIRGVIRQVKNLPEAQQRTALEQLSEYQQMSMGEKEEVLRLLHISEIPNELFQLIRKGDCILFVGAGLSKEAGYPDGAELAMLLRREIRDAQFVPDDDAPLSDVAQAFEASKNHSRADLLAALKHALAVQQGRPLNMGTYRLIANIPHLNRCIITTNWDSLLDDAIKETVGFRPEVIVEDKDIGKVPGSRYIVYKMHGSMDKPETVVVTRSDYQRMSVELYRPESLFMNSIRAVLTSNVVIYVGFSLQDTDFQRLLGQIQNGLADRRTGDYQGRQQYAILPRLDTPEREYRKVQRQWSEQHVRVVNCTAREFFEEVYLQTSEFIDREREVSLLMGSKDPFVEVVGNVGSGKSHLLREIEVRYRQELQWAHVAYVDMAVTDDPVYGVANSLSRPDLDSLSRIREFASSRGLLILLDSVDRIPETRLGAFCEEFIPGAIDPSQRLFNRIVWSGRFSIADRGLPPSVKDRMLNLRLSLFSESTVAALVQQYADVVVGRRIDAPEAEVFAQAILELTGGGHPGLIKEILRVMNREPVMRFSPFYLRSPEGKAEIQKILMSRIDEALPSDPTVRAGLENTLCVARGIHRGIVDYLVQRTLLDKASCSLENYLSALWGTHLFDVDSYPMYSFDQVIRHVLRQNLASDRVFEVNSALMSYFDQATQSSAEDVQAAYLIEWLYHKASDVIYRELSEDQRFISLHSDISEYRLRSFSPSSVARRLARSVRSDGELSSLLVKCVGTRFSDLIDDLETLPIDQA
jgi:hypothetical protein